MELVGGGYPQDGLVAADGGIFTFGDARFRGSTGAMALNAPIVGTAPTPDGDGYWLVAADGRVFTFGDAQFYGSAASDRPAARTFVSLVPVSRGDGYWILGAQPA